MNKEIEKIKLQFDKDIADLKVGVYEKLVAMQEPKQKFITVIDGFRGGLKLKECWVTIDEGSEGQKLEDCELIARSNGAYPYKILNDNGDMQTFKHLKFKPFSPENPPSVDWPVNNSSGFTTHFAGYEHGEIRCFINGCSSISNDKDGTSRNKSFKFLNIEEVE